jgi:hypothetical protein
MKREKTTTDEGREEEDKRTASGATAAGFDAESSETVRPQQAETETEMRWQLRVIRLASRAPETQSVQAQLPRMALRDGSKWAKERARPRRQLRKAR